MDPTRIPLTQIVNINRIRNDVQVKEHDGREYLQNISGHNSFFLSKPILKGKVYAEFVGSKPLVPDPSLKYEPSFRVGLAPSEYYYNYPLGQSHSIAYKADGSLIMNRRTIGQLEPYDFGDHIGIGLTVHETYRIRNKDANDPFNSVAFYKNGNKVSEELKVLTEDLYSFAGSLFNGARMRVAFEREELAWLPEGFVGYGEYLRQDIPYKDREMRIYEIKLDSAGSE